MHKYILKDYLERAPLCFAAASQLNESVRMGEGNNEVASLSPRAETHRYFYDKSTSGRHDWIDAPVVLERRAHDVCKNRIRVL